eukprot:sb/3468688/
MIDLVEPGHDPKSQVMQRQWDTLYKLVLFYFVNIDKLFFNNQFSSCIPIIADSLEMSHEVLIEIETVGYRSGINILSAHFLKHHSRTVSVTTALSSCYVQTLFCRQNLATILIVVQYYQSTVVLLFVIDFSKRESKLVSFCIAVKEMGEQMNCLSPSTAGWCSLSAGWCSIVVTQSPLMQNSEGRVPGSGPDASRLVDRAINWYSNCWKVTLPCTFDWSPDCKFCTDFGTDSVLRSGLGLKIGDKHRRHTQ